MLTELKNDRAKLIQELRKLDRTINVLTGLDRNNHELRLHIQRQNRRQQARPPFITSGKRDRDEDVVDVEDGEINEVVMDP